MFDWFFRCVYEYVVIEVEDVIGWICFVVYVFDSFFDCVFFGEEDDGIDVILYRFVFDAASIIFYIDCLI